MTFSLQGGQGQGRGVESSSISGSGLGSRRHPPGAASAAGAPTSNSRRRAWEAGGQAGRPSNRLSGSLDIGDGGLEDERKGQQDCGRRRGGRTQHQAGVGGQGGTAGSLRRGAAGTEPPPPVPTPQPAAGSPRQEQAPLTRGEGGPKGGVKGDAPDQQAAEEEEHEEHAQQEPVQLLQLRQEGTTAMCSMQQASLAAIGPPKDLPAGPKRESRAVRVPLPPLSCPHPQDAVGAQQAAPHVAPVPPQLAHQGHHLLGQGWARGRGAEGQR